MPPARRTRRVSEAGERDLIRHLREACAGSGPGPVLGIGDDAALLAPAADRHLVLSTDLTLENIHFRRDWSPPCLLGRKALAVSLSDLAAMGAEPVAFLLDLALPADWPLADFEAFAAGVASEAREAGIALVGGDTCAGERLHIGVTVIGQVEIGRALLRRGAVPGDRLAVTGSIGAAGAGLALLREGWRLGPDGRALPPLGGVLRDIDPQAARQLLEAQLSPRPELAAGRRLGSQAHAGLDLSDGLGQDVHNLCDASTCGARIEVAELPIAAPAREVFQRLGRDPIASAVDAGEDYRLLVAWPPDLDLAEGLHPIGTVTGRAQGVVLVESDGARPWPRRGFEHFSTS